MAGRSSAYGPRFHPLLTPRAFFGASGASSGEILVAGGCADLELATPCASVEILSDHDPNYPYKPRPLTWRSGAPMNTPRLGHCVVGVAHSNSDGINKVYAIGGASTFDKGTLFLKKAEKYDYRSDSAGWQPLADMKIGRYHATATWSENNPFAQKPYLYVMGGWTGSLGAMVLTNTVERFNVAMDYPPDPTYGTWDTVAPLQTARAGAVASSYGYNVYIMGGVDKNGNIPGMEVYDCSTNVWSTVNPINKQPLSNMKTPRMYAACPGDGNTIDVPLDDVGKIYVAGGKDINGNYLANVEYYNATTNIWCPLGDLNCGKPSWPPAP